MVGPYLTSILGPDGTNVIPCTLVNLEATKGWAIWITPIANSVIVAT